MAIARKVIILDFKVVEPAYIFATAALVFAASIGYWLVARYADARSVSRTDVERCFDHPDECSPEETDRKI